MKGSLSSLNGMPIYSDINCTEPVISLSNKVTVSDEFRRNTNARLEYLFGRRPAMYQFGDKLIAHPDIIEKINQYLL
jgi:hypothetical protein